MVISLLGVMAYRAMLIGTRPCVGLVGLCFFLIARVVVLLQSVSIVCNAEALSYYHKGLSMPVCLSVTLCCPIKTMQAWIIKSSLSAP